MSADELVPYQSRFGRDCSSNGYFDQWWSRGNLKRVAIMLETTLEQFEGTRSFIFGLLPTGGLKELIAVCWQQGCLLSWYCLVTNQGKVEVEDGSYILEQMLSNCKSLSLRYIHFLLF